MNNELLEVQNSLQMSQDFNSRTEVNTDKNKIIRLREKQ